MGGAAKDDPLDRIVPVAPDVQVPSTDFFRPPLFTRPQLNPAGTHVAALMSGGQDTLQLVVHDIESGEATMVDGLMNHDVYRHHWLNDSRLLFSLSYRKQYGVSLAAVEVNRLNRPYPVMQYAAPRLVAVPPGDRLRPLVAFQGESADKQGQVAVINTGLKRAKFVNLLGTSGGSLDFHTFREANARVVIKRFPPLARGISVGYGADPQGALSYAWSWDDGVVDFYHLQDDDWIPSPIDSEKFTVHGIGRHGTEVVVSALRYESEPSPVKFMSLVDGSLGDEILVDKGYDFHGGIIRDPATHAIVGLSYERSTPALVWFDERYEALQSMFEKSFPRRIVRMISWSDDLSVILLGVSSDRHPISYHLVDLKKKTIGLLKDSRPWLDPERLSGVNIVKFKTVEGRQLDAYLTLPKGFSKSNPGPLIVLPHGGPWVRDVLGFNSEAQFLASRGYAVLQPNYRGSPGTDWMFPEEDRWDFTKMHADVTRATEMVLKTGLFDRDRVAIMGGSFGAYLALSGGVHEPDLYRCVVGIAGVYDWAEVVRDRQHNQYSSGAYGFLLRKLGDPQADPAKFERISPINFVENLKAPMFVAHGKDDPVASRLESQRLVAQLKKHDKVHQVRFIAHEGHGMAHLENSVDLYERIEAFLAEHL
ncbi:MAG: hypothetical protein SynsKO_00090 [Synoicihabitans sp.]